MRRLFGVSAASNNPEGLPAIPAVAAISAASATAAASATTAVSATTAAVSAAPATAAAAFRLRPCFVHHEVAPAKILPIQRINCAIRVLIIGNFNEREAPRLARETIPNEIHTRWRYAYLREPLVELIFRRGKRKIPNIELLHLLTPSVRNPIASRGARRKRERRTRAVRVAEPPPRETRTSTVHCMVSKINPFCNRKEPGLQARSR
jgi:hypothetical protein